MIDKLLSRRFIVSTFSRLDILASGNLHNLAGNRPAALEKIKIAKLSLAGRVIGLNRSNFSLIANYYIFLNN